ncbi:uncharacterized protein LOC112567601 [Pomacea canaliculata]|uniref:uncharacterized protein LOC112567601 n=1 Tax=Pomacea canaliculata TaxID=400727 RepID=UPI000D73CD6B|nr:uncharacterized protein LOC112567601 [Pomacea canaliculata]
MSVGPAGVWSINRSTKLFCRTGTYGDNANMGSGWQYKLDRVKQVDVGRDTVGYIHSDKTELFRIEGINRANPLGAAPYSWEWWSKYIAMSLKEDIRFSVVNMLTTMILLFILLSMASCLEAVNKGSVPKAQVMLQLQGMDYSLFGYNSLKGCPLTSGRDPGFTLPIFSGEFHVTPDFRYSVPRGVVLSHDVSCDTSFTSKVVETPYDLTKVLTVTARLGRDKWGPPFSASQHFHKLSAQLTQHVLVVSTAVCSLYDLTLLLTEPPSFHLSFADWMIKLNNTDDEDKYLQFLDTYGTHFVSKARFGASITVIYKMDDNVYRLLTEDHVTSAASYSAPELFGYREILTSDQQKAIAEFRNHKTTTHLHG